MDNREVILDIQNITKTFPGVKALSDVSMQVMRGSVHALVGENGAGKSTLIKILTGVYHADEGCFYFKGQKADVKTPLEAQHMGLSVVHQELRLSETLTIAENVFLGRPFLTKLGLVDWKKLRSEAKKLLREGQFDGDGDIVFVHTGGAAALFAMDLPR